MKKLLPLLLCAALLTACSANIDMKTEPDNTESIITGESETLTGLTEEPSVKPVSGLESLSVKKIKWGHGEIINHRPPEEPSRLNKDYFDLDGEWLLSDGKKLALTFDEGYENGFTPSILDTLKEKNVKAVFFVTYDFARDNPELVQRMLDEGHTVGNHSYHHYAMDELDTQTAREEIDFLHRYIRDKYNYTMSYFRFPMGEFSEKSLAIAQSLGYKSVFWSYAYADWDPESQPEPDRAFASICESTHPGEIMLLHAVSKTNAEILAKVIDDVRAQGYTFTTEL
ncbi:MAG: polysaccharide deacetylase family protein [Eubacterium sp.]|nr:polysaccharide deacetylase family protein [Eubacterium sp.]